MKSRNAVVAGYGGIVRAAAVVAIGVSMLTITITPGWADNGAATGSDALATTATNVTGNATAARNAKPFAVDEDAASNQAPSVCVDAIIAERLAVKRKRRGAI
ncbi:MAG: hypothetical protein KBG15_12500, partial [Kofleriaceae bacterium]|nr:hypothetical protein [Kofleriaceae bacterium]